MKAMNQEFAVGGEVRDLFVSDGVSIGNHVRGDIVDRIVDPELSKFRVALEAVVGGNLSKEEALARLEPLAEAALAQYEALRLSPYVETQLVKKS